MEIFRILTKNKIIYLLIAFSLVGCYSKIHRQKPCIYENEKYLISRCANSLDYAQLLSDTTISTNGEHLYKGRKITPYGDIYNDETGIFLTKHPKKKVEIILFKNKMQFAGKVTLKGTKSQKEIKVEKSDLQKIFEPEKYKIYILENNIPILKYDLLLIY